MSKENKIKKPFYKKWWVWVIAIILIAAIANPSEEDSSEDVKQPASESSAPKAESKPQEEVKAEEPKKEEAPKVNPKISKAEFDKLQNGMTYEEVVAIIGGEGDVMSEVGEKGTAYYTIMYMYEGEKGIGANANLTFQDGKLNMKAQFGLK